MDLVQLLHFITDLILEHSNLVLLRRRLLLQVLQFVLELFFTLVEFGDLLLPFFHLLFLGHLFTLDGIVRISHERIRDAVRLLRHRVSLAADITAR